MRAFYLILIALFIQSTNLCGLEANNNSLSFSENTVSSLNVYSNTLQLDNTINETCISETKFENHYTISKKLYYCKSSNNRELVYIRIAIVFNSLGDFIIFQNLPPPLV